MNKLFTILLFVLFSLTAYSQDYWEPLDGPYGGRINGALKTDNCIFLYNSQMLKRSTDGGKTWIQSHALTGTNVYSKMHYSKDKTLYLFVDSVQYKNIGFIYKSTDEGITWSELTNYTSDCKIGYEYIFSFDLRDITYRTFSDTAKSSNLVFDFMPKSFYVDHSDNIYSSTSLEIYLSTDQGRNFTKIVQNDSIITDFLIDDNDCIYYCSFDSAGPYLSSSEDMGQNWSKVHYNIDTIDHKYGNRFIIVDRNNIYVELSIFTANPQRYLFIEDFSQNKITKFGLILKDTFKLSNSFSLFNAGTVKIVRLSDENLYITNDKYLNNLELIKTSFQNITRLLGGTNLLLTSQLSYLNNDKFIFLNNSSCIDDSYINISKRDIFWTLTNCYGLSVPDVIVSSDYGKSYKLSYYSTFPYVVADNSKKEVIANCVSYTFQKLNDKLEFEPIAGTTNTYPKNMYFDKNDDLLLFNHIKNLYDTLNISKLEGTYYQPIFSKNVPIAKGLKKVVMSENEDFYVMTDSLLYRLTNEGDSIETLYNGGDIGISLRDVITVDNVIYMATNKGVMRSSDFGKKWVSFNNGLNNTDCLSLAKLADKSLYVSVSRDVVYRSRLHVGVKEEIASKEEFSLSPNPASDFIEISVPENDHTLKCVAEGVRIFNVFGEEVNLTPALSATEREIRIDVSGLPSGVYFIRVETQMRKFIKI